jgi:hypothetical protein
LAVIVEYGGIWGRGPAVALIKGRLNGVGAGKTDANIDVIECSDTKDMFEKLGI